MSRVSMAERTRVSLFVARGVFGRVTSGLLVHSPLGALASFGKPDRLLIAPQDLRTADPAQAAEIYAALRVEHGSSCGWALKAQ